MAGSGWESEFSYLNEQRHVQSRRYDSGKCEPFQNVLTQRNGFRETNHREAERGGHGGGALP